MSQLLSCAKHDEVLEPLLRALVDEAGVDVNAFIGIVRRFIMLQTLAMRRRCEFSSVWAPTPTASRATAKRHCIGSPCAF